MKGCSQLLLSIQCSVLLFPHLYIWVAASKEGDISALYCQWEWWFREDLSAALGIDLERVTFSLNDELVVAGSQVYAASHL